MSEMMQISRAGHSMGAALKTIMEKKLYTDLDLIFEDTTHSSTSNEATKPVTLKAHRSIMAAGSEAINRMLLQTSKDSPDSPNGVVLLPPANLNDVNNVISFIYTGQALMPSSCVDSFVSLMKTLEVQGLVLDENCNAPTNMVKVEASAFHQQNTSDWDSKKVILPSAGVVPKLDVTGVIALDNGGGHCLDCGRIFSHLSSCKRHHVNAHQASANIPCQKCGKIVKNAIALNQHMAAVHKISMRAIKQATGAPGQRKRASAVKLPKALNKAKGSPKNSKAMLSSKIKKEVSGASKVKIENNEMPTIKKETAEIPDIKKEKLDSDIPKVKKEKIEFPIPAEFCVLGSSFWMEAVSIKSNIPVDVVSKVDVEDIKALAKTFGRVCPCGKTWKNHEKRAKSEYKKA